MKKIFLFFVFMVMMSSAYTQYFQTGQDPAYLKWHQINTVNFQIIYPDYYEFQAKQLAAMMEKVYKVGGTTLHHQPKKISIILHTQTVQSNGLVAWAPKRVEFYTLPHQDIYSQNWIEQLAIHEFRHVVQIDKINSELPKVIKAVVGQQGTAVFFGTYLPWWFIEGDAVVTETAFSSSGRGRFPSFLAEHRALAVEKGNYKYDIAYNGSFKNYVPGHYQLGYYLVGESRVKYGSELWNSVLERVGRKPLSLNPVNKVLKQETGMNKVQLYNSVFDSLRNVWIEEDKNFQPTTGLKVFTSKQKTYTTYRHNHWLNDTTIISYKTALNEIPSFVKIHSNGREEKIIHPGPIFKESINYQDEWVVWSEQVPNPRWQHSGKSVVRLLNVHTNEKSKINTEFTAFAPAISIQKDRVAVVESDFSSNYYLSVYSITDNKLLHRIQTQNNYLFSPEWLNENELLAVEMRNNTKHLVQINLETEELKVLVDRNLGEIKSLKVADEMLYFIASYSGKNELYEYNLKEKTIQRIGNARFGVESPSISSDGKKIVLSDYTADGFRLVELNREEANQLFIENIKKANYALADALAAQESGIINFSNLDTTNIKTKPYNKAAHLINFHSWAPASVDPTSHEIKPGISYMSQNKLGTAVLNIGYEWSTEEKTGKYYGRCTFKGWYPVFDVELNSGKRASKYATVEKRPGNPALNDTIFQRFTWKETNLGLNTKVPFNFSRGRFTRLLQPEMEYDFTLYDHNQSTPKQFINGNYQSLTYRLYYQQLRRRSQQDMFPDFGFVVDAIYRHSPFGQFDLGNLKLAQSYLFLPGILKNHGMRFYSGIQDKNAAEDFSFSDAIRYPRGWGRINTNQMFSFAFDYKMPIFYPEKSIGGLVYFKRLKTALFADYAHLNANLLNNGKKTGTYTTSISSFGTEFICDLNLLRFYAPVELGFRASYLPKTKNVYLDLLFSIDFNSL